MTVKKLISQAEFARLMGVNRSTVSRTWKAAGRLVMSGKLVDVEASRARIAGSAGGRDDVADRHAASRTQAESAHQQQDDDATAEATGGNSNAPADGRESRASAQARKETAAADIAELERDKARGNLIPKDDVNAALKAFAAGVRARVDVLADQLAAVVAPVTDLDEVHALLSEHARDILAGVADDMARQAATLKGPPA